MATSCLSFHAPYRCRHAGACCAAPWQVRADAHVVRFVTTSGFYTAAPTSMFTGQPARPDGEDELSLAKGLDGVCVFRADRRCSIQLRGGEAALPIGCRHYPRVLRLDRQGITLSLSHYCPTAASLLAGNGPVRVVPAAEPLALAEPLEGLDAREALPPLLRPDLLTDLDGYAAWELAAVNVFAETGDPRYALQLLAGATEAVRDWKPGGAPLTAVVAEAFSSPRVSTPRTDHTGLAIARTLNRGLVSLDFAGDLDQAWMRIAERDTSVGRVVANYLAARTFGNWVAYQGRGLRTVVIWLQACVDIVRLLLCRAAAGERAVSVADAIEAVRQADYVMLHTIDSQAFAHAAREVEA